MEGFNERGAVGERGAVPGHCACAFPVSTCGAEYAVLGVERVFGQEGESMRFDVKNVDGFDLFALIAAVVLGGFGVGLIIGWLLLL